MIKKALGVEQVSTNEPDARDDFGDESMLGQTKASKLMSR